MVCARPERRNAVICAVPALYHAARAPEQAQYSIPRARPSHCRCCSVDGDADRLVYFSPEPAQGQQGGESDGSSSGGGEGGGSGGISLLDGDKVAILAAVFIRDLMDQLPAELLQGVQVGRGRRGTDQDLLMCTWARYGDR